MDERNGGASPSLKADPIKWAAMAICITFVFLVAYILFKYTAGIFAPFLIAYAVASLSLPVSERVARRSGLPKKLCSVLTNTAILVLMGAIVYFTASRLILEVVKLAESLGEDGSRATEIVTSLIERIGRIGDGIPFLAKLKRSEETRAIGEYLERLSASLIEKSTASIAEKIPSALASLASSLPNALLFTVVAVISTFYLSSKLESLNRAVITALPAGIRKRMPSIKKSLSSATVRYLKAYLILTLITAAVLYSGLLIIGVAYPFLLAIILAVIDLLPVLGVGVVLIPYGIFELLSGNIFKGVGLILLYAAITLIRQFIEPKLVGKSLGLDPLLTLISTYAGYKLFGVFGMIAAPFVFMAVCSVVRAGRTDNAV